MPMPMPKVSANPPSPFIPIRERHDTPFQNLQTPSTLVLLRSEVGLEIARSIVRRATARAGILGALAAGTCGSGEFVLCDGLVASYTYIRIS